jgi:hypothetical protein
LTSLVNDSYHLIQASEIFSQFESILHGIGSVREKVTFDCLEEHDGDMDIAASESAGTGYASSKPEGVVSKDWNRGKSMHLGMLTRKAGGIVEKTGAAHAICTQALRRHFLFDQLDEEEMKEVVDAMPLRELGVAVVPPKDSGSGDSGDDGDGSDSGGGQTSMTSSRYNVVLFNQGDAGDFHQANSNPNPNPNPNPIPI